MHSSLPRAFTRIATRLAIRRVVGLCLIVLACFALPGIGRAAGSPGLIDQSQETQTDLNSTPLVGTQIGGQTFTAGRTGLLDQVDLLFSRYGSPGTLTVEIRAVAGGLPSASVLASVVVPLSTLAADPYAFTWLSVRVAPGVQVVAGSQYAIVGRAEGAIFPTDFPVWADASGDPYLAGTALTSVDGGVVWFPASGADFAFRTYVSVPDAAQQITALINLVLTTNAGHGIVSSLHAKLAAIQQAMAEANVDHRADPARKLMAFINEVAAQSGKALSAEQASHLINEAQSLLALIG